MWHQLQCNFAYNLTPIILLRRYKIICIHLAFSKSKSLRYWKHKTVCLSGFNMRRNTIHYKIYYAWDRRRIFSVNKAINVKQIFSLDITFVKWFVFKSFRTCLHNDKCITYAKERAQVLYLATDIKFKAFIMKTNYY